MSSVAPNAGIVWRENSDGWRRGDLRSRGTSKNSSRPEGRRRFDWLAGSAIGRALTRTIPSFNRQPRLEPAGAPLRHPAEEAHRRDQHAELAEGLWAGPDH